LSKKVGVICGGSGSSKFATLFSEEATMSQNFRPAFIANVADNYWYHGIYVCPDVDILMHSLAGKLDTSRGWGMKSDAFKGKNYTARLRSEQEWFSLGDTEAALCELRTELLKSGWLLSSITRRFAERLGIRYAIHPSTDDRVTTFVRTVAGLMHLQEYWVKRKASPHVLGVYYDGIDQAEPNPNLSGALSDTSILCPANPITSILPTILISGVTKILRQSNTIAISPFTGEMPFSGPAGMLMNALGLEANSFGVASLYKSFLKLFVLNVNENPRTKNRIKDLGIECVTMNTLVRRGSKSRLAKEIMELL
jgi:LPPG:FO 2-phospho-L-lactate transferase